MYYMKMLCCVTYVVNFSVYAQDFDFLSGDSGAARNNYFRQRSPERSNLNKEVKDSGSARDIMKRPDLFHQNIDFPAGVSGKARYDYFKQTLPEGSRGIYVIYSSNGAAKYIGSAIDINKRLCSHHRNGILIQGDIIHATIFRPTVRQKDVLNYERKLIKEYNPVLNKHTGTPGRPWQSEQLAKLSTFLKHNKNLLTPQGETAVLAICKGINLKENYNLRRGLLRVMRLFR